jgi:pimeloyl-ACP methyl ester carboxylesterase
MRTVGKGAALAAAAAGGVVSAAWATQRLAARRIRSRPDLDAGRALERPVVTDHRLRAHDGGVIYVVEEGSGPPVVLSHGVTLSNRTWVHQLELLPKEGLRAVAFDHRGHGRSELGEGAEYSLENLAEDVNTVVTELDLRDAILVGHSMGGVAVQAFVLRHPDIARERVRGIVLLSTLARSPVGSRATQVKHLLERIVDRVPDTTPLWRQPNLGLVLARLGFGRDPSPSHVELVRQMMTECPHQTRIDAPRTLVGLDLTDQLATIDLPTLVVVGSADVLTPPGVAKVLARRIPNARLAVLEGGGHMLMLERTEELNRMIVDFAREVGALP